MEDWVGLGDYSTLWVRTSVLYNPRHADRTAIIYYPATRLI